MKRILKITLGVIAILVGLFALLTPFTPGSWLILVGLAILFGKKLPPWLRIGRHSKNTKTPR